MSMYEPATIVTCLSLTYIITDIPPATETYAPERV